jgi:uncharacterized protein (DUF2384 family)
MTYSLPCDAREFDGLATEHYSIDMATVFADEALRIREVAHLSDVQIGRAVGAAPSTVRDWFARRSSPTGKRAERVAELAEIVDRLARVIQSDYIPVWMSRPIEALDDRKPLDLIARGHARRVVRVVSELESPGAV